VRKWFLVVLLVPLLALGVAIPFLDRIEPHLPDQVHALVFGGPPITLDIDALLAAGAGLRDTYRARWLAASAAAGLAPGEDGARRVCTATDLRRDCDFRSLKSAFAGARDGDVLVVSPGVYKEAAVLAADWVTVRAEPGAHLQGRAAQGKAALVITGEDTVIEGLECSGIAVPDRNGACIRLEGRNLTLRGVHFHDSEQGVLTGRNSGHVVVEDSRFERLGAGGQAHAIYMGGGPESALIVRRTHILGTKGEGHGVKSRAASTVIEDSVIASLGAKDSRLIDLPVGGLNVVRGNVLQNGTNSANADLIGIGLELKAEVPDAAAHASSVTGNIMILDRANNTPLHARHVPDAEFLSNAIVGGPRTGASDGNFWFRNRAAAGLPELPGLLE
jgi:hypothetical protein